MIWGFGASAHVGPGSVTGSAPLASEPTRSAPPGCLASIYLGIEGPGQKRMRTVSWRGVGGSYRHLGLAAPALVQGAHRVRLLPSLFQVPVVSLGLRWGQQAHRQERPWISLASSPGMACPLDAAPGVG